METSLPELPFSDYGEAEIDPSGVHSSVKASPRTHPRTDLETLTPWVSFLNDVHQVISTTARAKLTPDPFKIWVLGLKTYVQNEEDIRTHAKFAFHKPVETVVQMLGVQGKFVTSGGGNTAIIGSPDFLWIMNTSTQPHPKVVVRVHCLQ